MGRLEELEARLTALEERVGDIDLGAVDLVDDDQKDDLNISSISASGEHRRFWRSKRHSSTDNMERIESRLKLFPDGGWNFYGKFKNHSGHRKYRNTIKNIEFRLRRNDELICKVPTKLFSGGYFGGGYHAVVTSNYGHNEEKGMSEEGYLDYFRQNYDFLSSYDDVVCRLIWAIKER